MSFVPTASTPSHEATSQRIAKLRTEYLDAARAATRAEAARMRALAALQEAEMQRCEAPNELDHALRARAAECAAELRVSDHRLLGEMADAHTLVHGFPKTFNALTEARLTTQHTTVIVREAGGLAPGQRPDYESRCIRIAERTTPSRLRSRVREIADSLHALTINDRHRLAAGERRVWVRDLPDGMAELGAVLPAVLAYGIKDRLTTAARVVKHALAHEEPGPSGASSAADVSGTTGVSGVSGVCVASGASAASTTLADRLGIRVRPGTSLPENFDGLSPDAQRAARERARRFARAREARSLDSLRADLLADLLLSGTSGADSRDLVAGITANIQLIIPADGAPARLDGHGPIDAATARRFAASAPGWDRIAYDASGALIATDRRQPSEAMRRILEARDAHCRFPGCQIPAARCELDHTIEWARSGPTAVSNLGHLCPRHHRLKHPDLPDHTRWRVEQDRYGTYTWTSPTGESYSDQAEHPYDSASPRAIRAVSGDSSAAQAA